MTIGDHLEGVGRSGTMTIGDHLEGIIAGTLWEKMNASERIWLAKVTALFMNRKETNT